MAQIAFAAILTALGASGSSYKVITVFGAVNTAIAGILALVKGRGLPARLRKDWVGLRQVRDYIEERERDLEQGVGIEDLPALNEFDADAHSVRQNPRTAMPIAHRQPPGKVWSFEVIGRMIGRTPAERG